MELAYSIPEAFSECPFHTLNLDTKIILEADIKTIKPQKMFLK
jgi:hypothetical protein